VEELKRWIVLLLSGLTGAAAAVGHAVLTFPGSQDPANALSRSDAEWVKTASAMEVCVVFFAVLYLCGGFLALLLRSPGLAAEIKKNGSWHLSLLGAALLLMALQRLWFTREGGWRRFDTLFSVACMGALIALAIVFKLGIGRGEKAR
jgi:hypothetical protein